MRKIGFKCVGSASPYFTRAGKWKFGNKVLDVKRYFSAEPRLKETIELVGYDYENLLTPEKFSEITEFGAALYRDATFRGRQKKEPTDGRL